MPLAAALEDEMEGQQEIGEIQLIERGGGDKPYHHQEQSSSDKEEEEMKGWEHETRDEDNIDAVDVAAEKGRQVITDGKIKNDGKHMTTEDEMNKAHCEEDRAAATTTCQSIIDIGDVTQDDDDVVLLEVGKGNKGSSSTTTAPVSCLTLPNESINICSSIASSPLDHHGYCTTQSQEVVEEERSMLRTNKPSLNAGIGVIHTMTMTPQQLQKVSSISEEELVMSEEEMSRERERKCKDVVEPSLSVIQKLNEKGLDNVVITADGDLSDPPISKHRGVVMPRNPYTETNRIVSISESCKVARAQAATDTATVKTRAAEGDDFCIEEKIYIQTSDHNVRCTNDVEAGRRGRFILHPEREGYCIDDGSPETAFCSISDTQQIVSCKQRIANLESSSPIQPSQLPFLWGGDTTNVDAQFSSSPKHLKHSSLPPPTLGAEVVIDRVPTERPGQRYKKQPLPSHFCVCFSELSEEQERVSVGLLRILHQDRVVLDENISLVYTRTLPLI